MTGQGTTGQGRAGQQGTRVSSAIGVGVEVGQLLGYWLGADMFHALGRVLFKRQCWQNVMSYGSSQ